MFLIKCSVSVYIIKHITWRQRRRCVVCWNILICTETMVICKKSLACLSSFNNGFGYYFLDRHILIQNQFLNRAINCIRKRQEGGDWVLEVLRGECLGMGFFSGKPQNDVYIANELYVLFDLCAKMNKKNNHRKRQEYKLRDMQF